MLFCTTTKKKKKKQIYTKTMFATIWLSHKKFKRKINKYKDVHFKLLDSTR